MTQSADRFCDLFSSVSPVSTCLLHRSSDQCCSDLKTKPLLDLDLADANKRFVSRQKLALSCPYHLTNLTVRSITQTSQCDRNEVCLYRCPRQPRSFLTDRFHLLRHVQPCGQCIARKVPNLCRPFINGVEDPTM